ncbi:hypothetical protein [Miltoncostaea oceani]|uniref:hypothetical protein n=1 Tax=Miltoncostaea oceani TaxID=2843216 RepID=UPI001C3E370B|nr:hypothetical protein [Miltoncostaea oceani]
MAESSVLDLVPVWRILPEAGQSDGAILIMRDGSFRMIMRAGAVNFDMKSPSEQGAISDAFGALLNSLSADFPLQILVHTKNLDANSYMRQFESRRRDTTLPALTRALIEDHCTHFEAQVRDHNLLQREFYFVVPYGVETTSIKKGSDSLPGWSIIKALITPDDSRFEPKIDALKLDIVRQQLDLRAHQLEGYLGRIEIPSRRLNFFEVRELLYEMYNPDAARRQRQRSVPRSDRLFSGPRRVVAEDAGRRAAPASTPNEAPQVLRARPVETTPRPAPPRPAPPRAAPADDRPEEGRRRARPTAGSPPAAPGHAAPDERRRSRPAAPAPASNEPPRIG